MEAKKFTINLDRYDVMGDALIIPVPDEVSDYFLDAGYTRMKCTLNGVHQMYRALNSRGEAGRYLLLNKKIAALLDLEEGQAISVQLEADESQYGYPVPIEWEEILLFDEPVAKIFAELTPERAAPGGLA